MINKFPCNECKSQNVYYACEQSSCEKYKEYKKLKDVNPIYIKLAQIAFDSVIETMLEGEKKHGVDGWKSISATEHLRHAYMHAENAYTGDKNEKHAKHCLTRCAIVDFLEDAP